VDRPLEFHERPFRQDRLRHDIIGSLALDAMPLTDNEDLEEEADQIGAVTGQTKQVLADFLLGVGLRWIVISLG